MGSPRAYVRCDGRRIELNLYDNAIVNQVTIAADDALLLAKELLSQALRMKSVEERDRRADERNAASSAQRRGSEHPLPLSGSGR